MKSRSLATVGNWRPRCCHHFEQGCHDRHLRTKRNQQFRGGSCPGTDPGGARESLELVRVYADTEIDAEIPPYFEVAALTVALSSPCRPRRKLGPPSLVSLLLAVVVVLKVVLLADPWNPDMVAT